MRILHPDYQPAKCSLVVQTVVIVPTEKAPRYKRHCPRPASATACRWDLPLALALASAYAQVDASEIKGSIWTCTVSICGYYDVLICVHGPKSLATGSNHFRKNSGKTALGARSCDETCGPTLHHLPTPNLLSSVGDHLCESTSRNQDVFQV